MIIRKRVSAHWKHLDNPLVQQLKQTLQAVAVEAPQPSVRCVTPQIWTRAACVYGQGLPSSNRAATLDTLSQPVGPARAASPLHVSSAPELVSSLLAQPPKLGMKASHACIWLSDQPGVLLLTRTELCSTDCITSVSCRRLSWLQAVSC